MVWFAMCVSLEYKLFSRAMHWFDTVRYTNVMQREYSRFCNWEGSMAGQEGTPIHLMRVRKRRTLFVKILSIPYKIYKIVNETNKCILRTHSVIKKIDPYSKSSYTLYNYVPGKKYEIYSSFVKRIFDNVEYSYYYNARVNILTPFDIQEIRTTVSILNMGKKCKSSDFGPRVHKMLIKCIADRDKLVGIGPYDKYIRHIDLYCGVKK